MPKIISDKDSLTEEKVNALAEQIQEIVVEKINETENIKDLYDIKLQNNITRVRYKDLFDIHSALEKMSEMGLTIPEMAKVLNTSIQTIKTNLKQENIKTSGGKNYRITDNEDFIKEVQHLHYSGYPIKEIAEKTGVSSTTISKILAKNESELTNKQLQDKLTNIYLSDENISGNETLANIITLLTEQKSFTESERDLLIVFTRVMDNVNQNKYSVEDAFKVKAVQRLDELVRELNCNDEKLEEDYLDLQLKFEDLISKFQEDNNYKMFSLAIKYIPENSSLTAIEKAKFALDAFENSANEEAIEEKLAYLDLCKTPNTLLNLARKYGMVNYNFDVQRAGAFILSANRYNEMIKNISDENFQTYANIINKMFIENYNNDYPTAYKMLNIYMETSDTFKQFLLGKTISKSNTSPKELEEFITEFHNNERLWDIDNNTEIKMDEDKFENQVIVITSNAKNQLWKKCNGNIKNFDSLLKKFYASAKSSTNIHDNVLKVHGPKSIGKNRMYATENNTEENIKYVFNEFSNITIK